MGCALPAAASLCLLILNCASVSGNDPPEFTADLDGTVLSEDLSPGTSVGSLAGWDPEGATVRYGLAGTDRFHVEPISGEVTLLRPLDHEVNDTLRFYVTIEDDANNLVKTAISVIVLDVNDNPPVFENDPYEISVSEDTKVGTTIFKDISVEDSDLSGESLEVFCKEHEMFPNTCEKFDITAFNSSQKMFHGGVILKGQLNYSERQLYQLLLIATDGSHNASTGLEVKVVDIQDSPPVFQGSLTGVIQEDDPIGTLVMRVHARDGDKGAPRKIVYDLLTNPLDYFLLDPESGELRTGKPLDREALQESTGVLSLIIRARELLEDGVAGNDSLNSATTLASVTIKDVNDEPPQFNQREYRVTLSESTPPGTPLPNLNITVTDPDIGVNAKFALKLSDVSGAFTVEPTTGSGSTAVSIRIVNGPLDYENPNNRKFILLVIAEETETVARLSSTATVTVEVTDANDNSPQFERSAYTGSVDETALPGDLVTTIIATDADTGTFGTKGIVYKLNGHGAEMFEVDNKTGVITVAGCELPGSPQCLDFETKSVYYLNLQATDDEGRGQTSIVPLKITLNDNNDNAPVFTSDSYKAIIDEGSPKFEPPLFVQARDVDKTSEISYSIVDGNVRHLFFIDSVTGEITVTDKNGLDMTNVSSHVIHLTVQASDGAFNVECSVVITVLDVNNNIPIFEQTEYIVTVPENSLTGTSVERVVAHDADTGINSELVYRIEKGGFEDFGIDNKTGVISVISKLDFDRRNSYSVHIIAVDGGTPALTGTSTLSVSVANTNDKVPFFSPPTQRAEVKEDAKVGEVVHQLVAKDLDVNSTDALNYAATDPISAVDKNGKEVLADLSFKDFFSVDQRTGLVTVAKSLRREIAAILRITVLVTDITAPTMQQGTGTLIITIIDVNDFAPMFLKPWSLAHPGYTVELLEEQPPGTILGTFTALDQDSNTVWYSIQPPNVYFEINNITGVVRTRTRVDYEKTPQLELVLVASDTGVPPLSSSALVTVIIININDMNPVFSQREYTMWVEENTKEGTVIGNVSATDDDAGEAGQIVYRLSQPSSEFAIDRTTGAISVVDSKKLDREAREEVTLQVIATDAAPPDQARTANAPVHIKIRDVNDNPPEFSQHEYKVNMVESVPVEPPAPILQLRALDRDSSSQLRFSIATGNVADVFRLDPITGIMYPRISLQGQLPHYSLGVQVTDGLHTDSAIVDISVQAINHNTPVFVHPSSSNSTVYIKENDDAVGTVVLTVKAIDADSGENGHVTYHFKVNDKYVQETDDFSIDENTGEMRAKKDLDRETKSSYQVVLAARDHGSPTWYEALRFLTIDLQDIDDNLPVFISKQPYLFFIKENAPTVTRLGSVEAVDRDEGDHARVYYYLVGNWSGRFSVDRLDGSVQTRESLDREQQDSYQLYVKATNDPDYYTAKDTLDLKNLKASESIAHVMVQVLDENDNAPVFSQPQYNAGAVVSAGGGELVAQLTATDLDAGLNGTLSYIVLTSHLFRAGSNLSSGSVIPSPFAISDSGKLTTAALVAEYNQERFKLEVVARERAPPFNEAKATVNIWIYEEQQLIRVILSRPPEEVHREKDQITAELSNVTNSLVVIDDIKYHIDSFGNVQQEWCDMYLHVVDRRTQMIATIPDVLKQIDSQYDFLKDYYAGFAIENVVPAYVGLKEESFEPALAALIALLIVLFVGCVSVIVVCCCFRHWIVSEPIDMKQSDMLIKKTVMDDLNTTENPLWIEQKLKLYEEQELTMHVFCEPEGAQLSSEDPRDSIDMSTVDNTYATIQHPNRRSSLNTMLSLGAGDYATLGGSVLPLDNGSSHSHSQQMLEAALGFQGSTFQVPEKGDLLRARSELELRINKDGQPEFVSELI